MKLFTLCRACRSKNSVKSTAHNRAELQMNQSDEIIINCSHCGLREKRHLNDIRAEADNKIVVIGLVLGLLISILLWYYFGLIGTIGLVIPFLIWQQQERASAEFNKYRIKRK